jgi:hypothetical protein
MKGIVANINVTITSSTSESSESRGIADNLNLIMKQNLFADSDLITLWNKLVQFHWDSQHKTNPGSLESAMSNLHSLLTSAFDKLSNFYCDCFLQEMQNTRLNNTGDLHSLIEPKQL